MITRVQVKNFRSLADVDVELSPLTVLVGRNGSGKSSFVDVLRFVRDALQQGLENAIINRGGIATLRRWSPRKPHDISIAVTIKEENFEAEYSFIIESSKNSFRVKQESCRVKDKASQIEDGFEIENGKMTITPAEIKEFSQNKWIPSLLLLQLAPTLGVNFYSVRHRLEGGFYNIFPNLLRAPQKIGNGDGLLDNAENFASVLRQIIKERLYYPDLVDSLSRAVEGVDDVRVQEVGSYLVTELRHNEINKSSASSPWFELAQESDGTIRMLGILVALYQKEVHRSFIAIEEPENALHPGALAVLADAFREATARHQILLTTQSPDLISRFNADELRVVERVGGITKIGRIAESQRQAIEEDLFSAGDLLRIEGLRREPVETTR